MLYYSKIMNIHNTHIRHDGHAKQERNAFVLELFTEHIPAHMQYSLIQHYTKGIKEFISVGDCVVHCSARRLTFILTNLQDVISAKSVTYKGPRVSFAKDSVPVIKFCERIALEMKISIDDVLSLLVSNEEGYYHAEVTPNAISVLEYLKQAFTRLFTEHLPEVRLCWYPCQKMPFVRPVRNVLTILNTELVSMELFGLKSCKNTYTNDYKLIEINSCENYLDAIKAHDIILDYNARQDLFKNYISGLAGNDGVKSVLDARQLALLDLVSNHDEIIYPFHIDISYEKYSFLNELPVEFIYASLDDQQQTIPVYESDCIKCYNERCSYSCNANCEKVALYTKSIGCDKCKFNVHGQRRIKTLVFGSNIPVTADIAEKTFKVCLAYLTDLYDLYIADVATDFNAKDLKHLPMYKVGSIYDKVVRLSDVDCCIVTYDNNHIEKDALLIDDAEIPLDIRFTPKLDLLSKSIQEFPQLQTVLHYYRYYRSNDGLSRFNIIYTLCHTDLTSALLRIVTESNSGLYGYENEFCKNSQLEWCRDTDWISVIASLQKKDLSNLNESLSALRVYFDDILDTFIGFYIADIDQKIGSKDPFGLKQLIYRIRLVGLFLRCFKSNMSERCGLESCLDIEDLAILIRKAYSRYVKQKLNKPEYDQKILSNILSALYGHAVNYFNLSMIAFEKNDEKTVSTNYWDALLHAIALDELRKSDVGKLDIIISTYRRLNNFLKTYSHDDIKIQENDDIVSGLEKLLNTIVADKTYFMLDLTEIVELSGKLNAFFDVNRIVDQENEALTQSRLHVLNMLKYYYDSYVLFTDRTADVYSSSDSDICVKSLAEILI